MMQARDEVKYNEATNLFYWIPSVYNEVLTEDPTATIAINDSSGTEVLAATAMTWSTDRLIYVLDTTDTDSFPCDQWYRVHISFTYGGVVLDHWMQLAVVMEPWYSNLTAADIEAESPIINEYEDDTTTDFTADIANAEWDLRVDLREETIPLTAGWIFDKDGLNQALKYKTLTRLWSRVSASNETAAYWRGKYETRMNGLKGHLLVDFDQDQIIDEDPIDNETHMLLP